jgi:hypothetical protein
VTDLATEWFGVIIAMNWELAATATVWLFDSRHRT